MRSLFIGISSLFTLLTFGQAPAQYYINATFTSPNTLEVSEVITLAEPVGNYVFQLPLAAISDRADSYFNDELLLRQEGDLFFSDTLEQTSVVLEGSGLLRSEFFKPILGDENSKKLEFKYILHLPSSKFSGEGLSGEGLSISGWFIKALPKSGLEEFYNPDLFRHFRQVLWDVDISYPIDWKVFGSLPFEHSRGHVKFQGMGVDEIQFYATPYLSSFPVDQEDVTIYFKKNFPPLNFNLAFQRARQFFQREFGFVPALPKHLVFNETEDLALIQSGEFCTFYEGMSQAGFEIRLIESILRAHFRQELLIDEFKELSFVLGFAHHMSTLYQEEYYPNEKLFGKFSNGYVARFFDLDQYQQHEFQRYLYLFMARQGADQPLSDYALSFSVLNIEAVAKGKSAMTFDYLRQYQGNHNFRRGMHRWFKSLGDTVEASPETFLRAQQFYANRDLSWWNGDLRHTSKTLDYSITSVDQCSYIVTANVANRGELILPYSISGYQGDTAVLVEWFDGHEGKKTVQVHLENYDAIHLDPNRVMPEISLKNNRQRTTGWFRGVEPIRFQFYTSLENPNKTQIFWMPTVKYNAYDQILLGGQFYNTTLIQKPFEYRISPEFSTGTGSLTGAASLKYNKTYSSGIFQQIQAGLYTRYYHYNKGLAYFRISPSLNFYFRKSSPKSPVLERLKFRYVHVDKEISPLTDQSIPGNRISGYQVFNAQFEREDGRLINPNLLDIDLQLSESFGKLSVSFLQRYMLFNGQWLGFRTFIGAFLYRQDNTDAYFNFGLSGTPDYLFDYYFIGRSDVTGIWSQQFFVSDGGFKSTTGVSSAKYLYSNSLNVPIWKGFGVFADFGLTYEKEFQMYYDYGARLAIVPDFLEFYFPIQNSQTNFLEEYNYLTHIRFVLNVDIHDIITRARRGWY